MVTIQDSLKKKLQTGGTTIKMEIIFERINEKKF